MFSVSDRVEIVCTRIYVKNIATMIAGKYLLPVSHILHESIYLSSEFVISSFSVWHLAAKLCILQVC